MYNLNLKIKKLTKGVVQVQAVDDGSNPQIVNGYPLYDFKVMYVQMNRQGRVPDSKVTWDSGRALNVYFESDSGLTLSEAQLKALYVEWESKFPSYSGKYRATYLNP